MAWIAGVAALVGAGVSAYSGSRDRKGPSKSAVDPVHHRLLGQSLPRATNLRTSAILNGGNLNVSALQQGLGYATNQFGRAESAIDRATKSALGFQQPLINQGDRGIDMLSDLAQKVSNGTFYNADDPAYKFQLDQGQRALNTTANAQGLYGSGGRAKELTKFGQGLASTFKTQELNNRLSAISPLASIGVNARNASSGIVSDQGRQLSSIRTGLGGVGASIFSQIGAVQNRQASAAGQSQYGGLLDQINGYNSLEGIKRGINAQNIASQQISRQNSADNAQAIGTAIASIVGAIGKKGGGA